MSEIRVNRIDDAGQGFVEATTRIKTNLAPVEGTDLTNKAYVDSRSGSAGVGASYVDSRDAYYYSQVEDNFVRKTGSVGEEITGVKTFEVAPRSIVTPSIGTDLANKTYVDAQDEQTLTDSKSYTDLRIENSGALPGFSNVEMPNWSYPTTWTGPDGITGTRTNYNKFNTDLFTGDTTTKFQIIGTNGISVTGATGYEVQIVTDGGTTASVPYQRIVVDGSGISPVPTWTSETDLGIGSILVVRSSTVNGNSDYSHVLGSGITGVIKYGGNGRYNYNGSGTVVSGTWRVLSWSSDDSGNPSSQFLAQRIS